MAFVGANRMVARLACAELNIQKGSTMTNETTASQPKSIGDDARFWLLLEEIGPTIMGTAMKGFIDYLDSKLCAPATQASATIQAAPKTSFDDYWWEARHKPRTQKDHAKAAWEFALKSAATIQEPVMVAEPVREALEAARYALKHASSLYSCGFNVRHAQSSMNGTDDTGVSASEYEAAAEDIRMAVSKARDLVRKALAAPMVADPAGVALEVVYLRNMFGFWHVSTKDTEGAIAFSAATVKAVPSEAQYQVYSQDDGEWYDVDKAQYDRCNPGWRRVKPAAPLADKTGGGE